MDDSRNINRPEIYVRYLKKHEMITGAAHRSGRGYRDVGSRDHSNRSKTRRAARLLCPCPCPLFLFLSCSRSFRSLALLPLPCSLPTLPVSFIKIPSPSLSHPSSFTHPHDSVRATYTRSCVVLGGVQVTESAQHLRTPGSWYADGTLIHGMSESRARR